MAALAADPDQRRRLMVELLARTGMRSVSSPHSHDDAMVRIGDTYWLRIPVGKLHNDRYVPLHPMLVELITDWPRDPATVAVGSSRRTRRRSSPSTGAPSTATSTPSRNVPVSVTSIPTSSATRSRPKRSTGA